MSANRIKGILLAVFAVSCLFAVGAIAAPKANHHNGEQMLGGKVKGKGNGRHAFDKKGNYAVSLEMKNGKVAGMHVNHATKGEIAVKKYKTNKKMAMARSPFSMASLLLAQDTFLGTTYIGFAYTDEYGNEEIYWFPYDMILDGDTGAVEYVLAG